MALEIVDDIPEEDKLVPSSYGIFDSQENEQACVSYLQTEIEQVIADAGREKKIARNKTIRRQRLAQPEHEIKDFPWPNASNVEPTMALQKTNTITTKIVQSLKAKTPLFVYDSPGQYKRNAEAITKLVNMYVTSPFKMNFPDKAWDLTYDCVSLGTQFVKVPFATENIRFKRIGQDGSPELVDKVVKASPDLTVIPFEDFLTRAEWSDLQKAPWVGVRYYKHMHELQTLEKQGFYVNVDQVLASTTELDDSKEAAAEALGIDTGGLIDDRNKWYAVYECNVFWDADGDGFPEDIIVHIEPDTGVILRAEYNDIGRRDYVRLPYIKQPHMLYALGVGDIMISLQDEASALHNMRNDSMQLSMRPFVVTAQGSGFGDDIGVYPGRFIETAIPREDIVVHRFPSIGTESIASEQILKSMADEATGASDILSGNDVGGYNRIGASGTQFLAGQSNTLLDAVADNLAQAFSEIGMLILYQMVRHSQMIDLSGLPEDDRLYCQQVLDMNVEDILYKFQFQARLAAIQDSRETKQQQAIGLFQLYTAYTDKIIQLSAQLDNPQLAQAPRVTEAVSTAMVGLTKLMEDALQAYDADNVQDFTFYVGEMEQALRIADRQKEDALSGFQSEMARADVQQANEAAVQLPAESGGGLSYAEREGTTPGEGPTGPELEEIELGGRPI